MINESSLAVAVKKLCSVKQSVIIESADEIERILVGYISSSNDWLDVMDERLTDPEISLVCKFYVERVTGVTVSEYLD